MRKIKSETVSVITIDTFKSGDAIELVATHISLGECARGSEEYVRNWVAQYVAARARAGR